MTTQAESVGQRIHRLRREKGLTLAQLAEAAGIHPSTLSDIEGGHAESPRYKTLQGISKGLETPIAEIVEGTRDAG